MEDNRKGIKITAVMEIMKIKQMFVFLQMAWQRN